MTKINKKYALLALLVTGLFPLVVDLPVSEAEFSLNFLPHGDGQGDGGRSGGGGRRGSRGQEWEFTDEDIMQEMVSEGGQEYYHVIIKDQKQDFAVDYYIKTASSNDYYDRDSGPASSSYGKPSDLQNFEDPFQKEAGNGSANPQRVYMRMILNDATMSQEFLKAKLTQKPIITQSNTGKNFATDITIDMSNSNYTQKDVPGKVDIHTLLPGTGVSDFDLSRDGGKVDVTAGRFTYANGSGPGQSNGAYSYVDGGFDVYKVDWLDFCDPKQNTQHDCRFDGGNRSSRGGRGGGWGGGR
jgi:hypothetical protein